VEEIFFIFAVFFELRFGFEKHLKKNSKNGRFLGQKSIRNRYRNQLKIDAEKRVDFRVTLLSFFMPGPCEISVLPAREHDFHKIAFFA